MAKDAVIGYLTSLKKHGEPLPFGVDDAEVEIVGVELGEVAL